MDKMHSELTKASNNEAYSPAISSRAQTSNWNTRQILLPYRQLRGLLYCYRLVNHHIQ